MNLLWSVPLLITSSYSFWLQIPQFQVWIFFTGYFYSKLSIFGRKVCVQCNGENFEVHNFVFLISDLVSMHNFTLEKVFFLNKILHFKFHTFCPPNVSQILNAVLCVSPSYLYLQNIFLECWHWYSFSLGWILYSLARWSHHLLFLSTRGMVSSWIWGGDITSFDELKGEGQRHFFFQTCSLLMLILVLKAESECWIGLIWG